MYVSTVSRGKTGEDVAVAFIQQLGWTVFGRNIRTPFGEIDILAQDHGTLVIVEVKRRLTDWQDVGESVDRRKIQRLARAATYMAAQRHTDQVRIDLIEIRHHNTITHLQNIEIS